MSGSGGRHEVETELDRDIGIVGAVAIGVGTMIAAGIFVLSGLAVSNVGTMAIVSFLLAALVAAFTAAAYAEFASIYPESGGGYMYVANVFDTDLAYLVGWAMILGYPASAAFYLASFSDWFFRFIYPALSIPEAIPYWSSGLVVLALLVGVNLKGTEETGLFQIVVTALKVFLILVFLFGGLQAFDASKIAESAFENLTNFREIGITSALVFITFFGFEAIATNAEEIEEPGRNVPRAIFFSMGFVTLVYTLVVLVVVLAVNDPQFLSFLAERTDLGGLTATEFVANNGEVSMGRAAQYYLGDVGFYVIIVGALFSMVSAANATVLAGSRVKLAMSRRDHLPEQFEALHSSLNTPYRAVLLTGSLIFTFVVVFTILFGTTPGVSEEAVTHPFGLHLGIEAIAHFADFMLLGGLIFVNVAIVQSRRKNPDVDRQFEVPGVPWVPAVAVLANLALLVNVKPRSFAIGLVAMGAGVLFWFAWKSRAPSVERIEEEAPTVVAEREPTDREYTVVVPVANPEHVDQLMRTADDLAKDNDGEVLVMSVVELPEQTPLSRGREYVDERRPVLDRAMALADEADVPVSGTIRIAHDPAAAILHTVEQYDADAVLLGWSGTASRRREIVLGSTVDTVVTEARCDVLVEKIGEDAAVTIDSILLPTAGGVHAELATEVAGAVARAEGAAVHAVNVVDPDATPAERERAEAIVARTAEALGDVPVETDVVDSDSVVNAIVERTVDHDLTVIGATREGLLQQLVFGAVPEAVGQRAANTVIMTKRPRGLTSWFRRWFRWE